MGLFGPGVVVVFQWPYRSDDSRLDTASRWARENIPGANRVANRLRGKPAGDPFIPTHTYDLAEMLPEFDRPDIRSAHVALEHPDRLDYAIALAHKRESTSATSTRRDRETVRAGPQAGAVSD